MSRASRHNLPGQLWHITLRWHEKSFLLKFARDWRAYGAKIPRVDWRSRRPLEDAELNRRFESGLNAS